MARKLLSVCVMMIVMCAWQSSARAADAAPPAQTDAAKAQTSEQRLQALEAQIKALEKKMPSWTENLSFKGDLRYRYEMIDQDGDGNAIQHRNRIRARFGLYAKVTEHADAGVVLSTGGSDPVSGNLTLGDSFARDEFRLDLGYINLHPTPTPGLNIWGGKIPNPFFTPGKSELIWDHDLNPEGGAVTYKLPLGAVELFSNLGGFWVVERSSGRGIDSGLFGAQGGARANLIDKTTYLIAGAGYYDYTNAAGEPIFNDDTKRRGNTGVATGGGHYDYVYDYNELEAFAEAGTVVAGLDVAVFGDFVVNTATGDDDKTAWLVGASLGKLKNPWDWALRYNYREVEADAILAAFTDSDFKGHGTDGKGHEVGADLMVLKNVSTGVTYFYNRTAIDHGKDYHRVQVDFSVKF